jgi:hypothetical protein
MTYPSTPRGLGHHLLFQGWPACRAGGLWPFSSPLDIPIPMPYASGWKWGLGRFSSLTMPLGGSFLSVYSGFGMDVKSVFHLYK